MSARTSAPLPPPLPDPQAQLLREAAQSRERLAVLNRVSQRLAASLDWETTLESIVRLAMPLLGDFGFFDVVEGPGPEPVEGQVRRVPYAHEDPRRQAMLEGSRWLRSERRDMNLCALSTGEAGLHPRIDAEWLAEVAVGPEHLQVMEALAFASMLTVPLRAEGRLLGSLTLFYVTGGRQHGAEDLELAGELAQRAAAAVVNAQLYAEARRERERAEAASRAKDEFLATLSHELRTPLTAILGYTGLLRMGGLAPERAERALDVIERNARAQAQLVNDLLDVSRIVAGKLALAPRPVRLHALVEAALDAARPAAEAKGLALHVALDPLADAAHGDPDRLQQVVWNLLSNAVKFTPPGGRVSVEVAHVPGPDGGLAELVVSDTGEGIAPDFLPHVFERFRQADGSSTRTHGGLGLGLAIVRHLVELHGGSVRAHSAGAGRGSTFTVQLPLRRAAARPAAEWAGPEAGAQRARARGGLEGLSVLLVEDEADAREALGAVLERGGARVTLAAGAQEARVLLGRGQPFDALVSDIGMPGEDGYALIRQVRAGPHAHLPAVALTAFARAEDRTRALREGFTLHIAKPVEPLELVAAVASVCGRAARAGG
jgi:signal transduction histidine kinase/ActR/RegA family two-component response regulator